MVIEFGQPEYEEEAERPRRRWFVWGLAVTGFLLAAGFLCQCRWLPTQINSDAMYPTLKRGEYVIVDDHVGRPYQVGDVVMLREPETGKLSPKRIMAVAGQTVEWRDGVLKIDGAEWSQIVPEGGELDADLQEYAPGMKRGHQRVVVPIGHVFVMGDYWGSSYDSFDYGPVELTAIQGVIRRVFWPIEHRREIH